MPQHAPGACCGCDCLSPCHGIDLLVLLWPHATISRYLVAGSSIRCAPCCGASLRQKRGRAASAGAPPLLRHLVEEPKRPGRPPGDGAAASNKRPLGENPAARKLSRVMVRVNRRLALNSLGLFSAACSMRVTFAGQFRVDGKIWRAMSLETDLRREVVWHSDAVAASLRQVGQM
jgi:hypothetical protein